MAATLDIRIEATNSASPVISGLTGKLETLNRTAGEQLGALGDSMKSIGAKMTLGLTTPIVGAGIAAVNLASDLSETTAKVGELFGDQAASMEEWAGGMARTFGQSKQTALDAAATFAIFGKGAGLAGEDLKNFSQDFTELASDLASFNNTSPEEAITAIGAALRGETEPIRKYGVLMDDASMRQAAFKLGLIETTKDALTPQQKALAAQALIFEQTTAAQGDFQRTSDGLANQTRILTATFKDSATELGEKLLPIALKVVDGVSWLVDKFSNLTDTQQQWIVIAGGVVAAAGPIIGVLGTLFSVVGPIIGAIGGAGGFTAVLGALGSAFAVLTGPIGLIVAAVAGLAFAWNRDFLGIKTKTLEIWGHIQGKLSEWAGSFSQWWGEKWDAVKAKVQDVGWWGTFRDAAGGAFETVKNKGAEWSAALAGWLSDAWSRLAQIDWDKLGNDIIGGIVHGILTAPVSIYDAIWSGIMRADADLRARMEMHSPSQLMARRIGLPMAQGIAKGIDAGREEVARAMVQTTNTFNVQLSGRGAAGRDVYDSVQLLTALYG